MTERQELPTVDDDDDDDDDDECCATCHYAYALEGDNDLYRCQRNPPLPNLLHGLAVILNARDKLRADYQFDTELKLPYLSENAEDEYFSHAISGCWPEVSGDDWCGEWKANDKPATA